MTEIRTYIKQYEAIIRFVIAMLAANYFWKLCLPGDEVSYQPAIILGMDMTWYIHWICDHVADQVVALLRLWGEAVVQTNGNRFCIVGEERGIYIVWGCSGLKQAFIWTVIMLTTPGKWQHKLWFIPLGWLCAYAFNIFRIAMIAVLTKGHPDYFEFLHGYVFKYLFYGMISVLWWIFYVKFSDDPFGEKA